MTVWLVRQAVRLLKKVIPVAVLNAERLRAANVLLHYYQHTSDDVTLADLDRLMRHVLALPDSRERHQLEDDVLDFRFGLLSVRAVLDQGNRTTT